MIEDLKALLGLPEEIDEELENKLLLILKATKQRLRFLLGGLEPPEEMNYIILDVSIIRFNRIGSEGLSSHSVEGESLSWVCAPWARSNGCKSRTRLGNEEVYS